MQRPRTRRLFVFLFQNSVRLRIGLITSRCRIINSCSHIERPVLPGRAFRLLVGKSGSASTHLSVVGNGDKRKDQRSDQRLLIHDYTPGELSQRECSDFWGLSGLLLDQVQSAPEDPREQDAPLLHRTQRQIPRLGCGNEPTGSLRPGGRLRPDHPGSHLHQEIPPRAAQAQAVRVLLARRPRCSLGLRSLHHFTCRPPQTTFPPL